MTALDHLIAKLRPLPLSDPAVATPAWEGSVVADPELWNRVETAPRARFPELRAPWKHGWRSQDAELDRLHAAAKRIAPTTVIETGTLAAHATCALAVAMEEATGAGRLFTIDYDGDPVQDGKGTISAKDWAELRANREANLAAVRAAAPSVEVAFREGDSRKVLPSVLEAAGSWDFWFQDSMHYKSGIREELDLMLPAMGEDAYIVFDNVDRVHPFGRWFVRSFLPGAEGRWAYRSLTVGRTRQLWAHRRLA